MSLFTELQQKRDIIFSLADKFGITDIRIFGSAARGEERADSDLDLLVNVTSDSEAFGFVKFQREMEKLTKRKIDLVFESGLYHRIKDQVLKESKLL